MSDSKLWKWGTFFSADKERLKLFGACCFGSWGWEREERNRGGWNTHTCIHTHSSPAKVHSFTGSRIEKSNFHWYFDIHKVTWKHNVSFRTQKIAVSPKKQLLLKTSFKILLDFKSVRCPRTLPQGSTFCLTVPGDNKH